MAQLEERAERSRQRRNESVRGFAARLQPLQDTFGWQLIDGEGMPTADAWVFGFVALISQAWLFWTAWQFASGAY